MSRILSSASRRLLGWLPAAVCLVVIAGCASNPPETSQIENPFEGYSTEEILRTGDQAFAAQEYDRAIFVYSQALEIEETAEIWYRLGVTKIRLDDEMFAWRAFSSAIELDPEHAPSYEELGLLSIKFGEPDAATRYLNKAVELDNTRWRSYNALGVIADVEKRYDDAVALYKRALEANPESAMLMSNIGYSYYLAGNLQEATNWYDSAIQAKPDYEPALKNLALLYARQGWYDDAVDTFRKVVDEPQAYNDTGYIAMRNGDLEEAATLLAEAIRLSPRYYELAHENLDSVRRQMSRRSTRETNEQESLAAGTNMTQIVFPETRDAQYRKVMPQALNVRAAPSTDAEIVNYLRTGNKVEIIMSQPGWAFVSYTAPSGSTITGWVNSRFLDIDDPAAVANTDEEPIIPERLIEAAELEAAADSIE